MRKLQKLKGAEKMSRREVEHVQNIYTKLRHLFLFLVPMYFNSIDSTVEMGRA